MAGAHDDDEIESVVLHQGRKLNSMDRIRCMFAFHPDITKRAWYVSSWVKSYRMAMSALRPFTPQFQT